MKLLSLIAATVTVTVCFFGELAGAADAMVYKLKSKRTVELGTFELTSTRLVVADPGYEAELVRAHGLGEVLSNCRTGTWNAQVILKDFDPIKSTFTSELIVLHTNVSSKASLKWKKQKFPIGVDYGQAGVYDEAHFHDHRLVPAGIKWTVGRPGPADPSDLWYSYCCELTTKKHEGSVIPHGVVTNAGAGDGAYAYSVARDEAGLLVAVWIVFLNDSGKG